MIKNKSIFNRKLLLLGGLGFSSGLPLALTGGTFQAWLKDGGIDLKTIGLLSLVGLPYTLKFLWAPIFDVYHFPFLTKRRGWIFVSQILLFLAIAIFGFLSPSDDTFFILLVALVIAFLSATQDIVIDAYRTEVLTPDERGMGASLSNLGYRLAMIVSGAVALVLADLIAWPFVFLLMSLCLLACSFFTFFSKEELVTVAPKSLNQAIIIPFKDFFSRVESLEVLFFILIYKVDIVMAVALTTPFMMEIGFSKTEIGAVTKGVGLVASILGSICGGLLYPKLGLKKCLIYFGIIQGFSTLSFSLLAYTGNNSLVMAFAVGFENFCAGLATTPFIAFLMACCNPGFAATSFALLSSFAAVSRVFAGAPTGYLVGIFGWVDFFIFCSLTAIPGVALVYYRFDKWSGVRK